MPSLSWNRDTWDRAYDWSGAGDEWSSRWGSTEGLWWGTLMPRLHSFLPAGVILELAPGYGRWTQYLKDLCDELVVVDMAEQCIEACRERFATSTNITYHVNDGLSLASVPDDSVDFVFSFDSLVHAEANVMDAYMRQVARKLRPGGAGFIHHSNAGHYRRAGRLARRLPRRLRWPLIIGGALPDTFAWRSESMTAELFEEMCAGAGLVCIGQEKLNWQYGRQLIDCISMFAAPGSRWVRPNLRVENRQFPREAARISALAPLYGLQGSRADREASELRDS